MSELAKMRAAAVKEFDKKFPPPSLELPSNKYDALEDHRKVEWNAWLAALEFKASQANAEQDALKLARYDWLVSKAFNIEFFDECTSIGTSYCYSGSDEGFARWVESQIDAAIRAASKTTPASREGE